MKAFLKKNSSSYPHTLPTALLKSFGCGGSTQSGGFSSSFSRVRSQLGTPLPTVCLHSPGIGASQTSFLTSTSTPTPPPPPPLPVSAFDETPLDDLESQGNFFSHSLPLESRDSPLPKCLCTPPPPPLLLANQEYSSPRSPLPRSFDLRSSPP